MHTVAELNTFRREAQDAGMSEDEISELVCFLAANPTAGEEMSGTGGCRKVRWAGRGKGKSGGYRTITFFSGYQMPVFLVTCFGKGEKSDLTQGEKNQLKELSKLIAKEYATKVTKVGARR